MKTLSKICDAADWFDEEFAEVISNELKEPARFHRKQWEFAQIFLSLRKLGFLSSDKNGLSLGGGNERVLYSIANHVNKLTVTDLYENNTTWDCARTNDPTEFIKSSRPFEYDLNKVEAMHMDMRYLEFEDNSFDFCYSSCAFEHIGNYSDFEQHLNEVNRVLKDGGIYVFTTELQFKSETIKDPHNYVFSKDYLVNLIQKSNLVPEFNVDTRLSTHKANKPLPSNIKNLAYKGYKTIDEVLFENIPHLILLRGNVPFTSVLFVLRKSSSKANRSLEFIGFEKTAAFLSNSISEYQNNIGEKELLLSPFSSLPNGISRFYLDHAEYFNELNEQNENDRTLFHSDYFWLGSGKREVEISFKIIGLITNQLNTIQLRVHKYNTFNSSQVDCEFEKNILLSKDLIISEKINLEIHEDYNYAFLAHIIAGNCTCNDLTIRINPIQFAVTNANLSNKKNEELVYL